jgi:competence protein ComEC
MYDIGFQLSFAAVLSIVCFYAAIKKKVYVHNKLLKFGWELVAVSLSAQILTTPLIIYHFQKIASYSLLNNLLIVPLSTIALITEIALCICPFEWLSIHVFTPVICKTITFMNSFTSSMNRVPFSMIETPVLDWYQVVLFSLLAYCLAIFFSNPGKVGFSMLLLITFAVSINILYEEITRKEIHQLVLLRSSKYGCMVHRHGEQATIYLSGNWKEHKISLAEQMHQLSKSLHIDEVDILDMGQSPKLIYPSSQTGAILLNAGALKGAELHKLLQKKSQLFLDGSTKLWKIRQWKKDPQNLHLRFLHTAEMGPIFLDCRDFHYRSVKNHFDAKKDPLSTHFGIL